MMMKTPVFTKRNKILSYLYANLIFNCLNPFNKSFRFTLTARKGKNRTVFMADGTINHGGLTDRYKGILTSYYLSKKHTSDFSIFYISPIHYSNIWHSEQINISKLSIHPFRFKIWYIYSLNQLEDFMNLNEKKYKRRTNLIYANENILAYLYENGKWEKHTKALNAELDLLGVNLVKNSFEANYNQYLDKDFELLHFRCLNYLNDFDDSRLTGIPEDRIEHTLDLLLQNLKAKYKNLEKKVFLSDSRRLLHYFDAKGYTVFSTETTKHMDNIGPPKEEYFKGYQENYLITLSKSIDSYIFYYNRNQAFNSHFAYYAAIFDSVPFQKYGYNLENLQITELDAIK